MKIHSIVLFWKVIITIATIKTDFMINGDFTKNLCSKTYCIWKTTTYDPSNINGWIPDPEIQIGKGNFYSDSLGNEKVLQLAGSKNTCVKQIFDTLPSGSYDLTVFYTAHKSKKFEDCQFTVSFNGKQISSVTPSSYKISNKTFTVKLLKQTKSVELKFCGTGSFRNNGLGAVLTKVKLQGQSSTYLRKQDPSMTDYNVASLIKQISYNPTNLLQNGNLTQHQCISQTNYCIWNKTTFKSTFIPGWQPEPQIEIGKGTVYNQKFSSSQMVLQLSGNGNTCVKQTLSTNLSSGSYQLYFDWAARKDVKDFKNSVFEVYVNDDLLEAFTPSDYEIHEDIVDFSTNTMLIKPVIKFCSGKNNKNGSLSTVVTNFRLYRVQFEEVSKPTLPTQSSNTVPTSVNTIPTLTQSNIPTPSTIYNSPTPTISQALQKIMNSIGSTIPQVPVQQPSVPSLVNTSIPNININPVPVPSPNIPLISPPILSPPIVTVPQITLPTMTSPGITVSAPTVQIPKIQGQNISIPIISQPNISMPNISTQPIMANPISSPTISPTVISNTPLAPLSPSHQEKITTQVTKQTTNNVNENEEDMKSIQHDVLNPQIQSHMIQQQPTRIQIQDNQVIHVEQNPVDKLQTEQQTKPIQSSQGSQLNLSQNIQSSTVQQSSKTQSPIQQNKNEENMVGQIIYNPIVDKVVQSEQTEDIVKEQQAEQQILLVQEPAKQTITSIPKFSINFIKNGNFSTHSCTQLPCIISTTGSSSHQLANWLPQPTLEIGLIKYYNSFLLNAQQSNIVLRLGSSHVNTCVRQSFKELHLKYYDLSFDYGPVILSSQNKVSQSFFIVKFNGRNVKSILAFENKLKHQSLIVKAIKGQNVLELCSFGSKGQSTQGVFVGNISLVEKMDVTLMKNDFIVNGDFEQNNCEKDICQVKQDNSKIMLKGWSFLGSVQIGKGTRFNSHVGISSVVNLHSDSCISQSLPSCVKGSYKVQFSWSVSSSQSLHSSLLQISLNSIPIQSYIPNDYLMHRQVIIINFQNDKNQLSFCSHGSGGILIEDVKMFLISEKCAINNNFE